MRASGRGGDLKFKYQVAATIKAWTLEPVVGTSGHRFRLSAEVSRLIMPWCDYRPLDLYLKMNGSKWLWNNLELECIPLSTLEVELQEHPTIIKENAYGK